MKINRNIRIHPVFAMLCTLPFFVACTSEFEYKTVVKKVDVNKKVVLVKDAKTKKPKLLDFSLCRRNGTNFVPFEYFEPGDTIDVLIKGINGTFYDDHQVLYVSDKDITLNYNNDTLLARVWRNPLKNVKCAGTKKR
ncbi:MAG: hypothetical protein J5742_03625 [Alphaproteobacteria bacterium]|nr:hypothetical protein [Alphaproteobacteria bacterium]